MCIYACVYTYIYIYTYTHIHMYIAGRFGFPASCATRSFAPPSWQGDPRLVPKKLSSYQSENRSYIIISCDAKMYPSSPKTRPGLASETSVDERRVACRAFGGENSGRSVSARGSAKSSVLLQGGSQRDGS